MQLFLCPAVLIIQEAKQTGKTRKAVAREGCPWKEAANYKQRLGNGRACCRTSWDLPPSPRPLLLLLQDSWPKANSAKIKGQSSQSSLTIEGVKDKFLGKNCRRWSHLRPLIICPSLFKGQIFFTFKAYSLGLNQP